MKIEIYINKKLDKTINKSKKFELYRNKFIIDKNIFSFEDNVEINLFRNEIGFYINFDIGENKFKISSMKAFAVINNVPYFYSNVKKTIIYKEYIQI